MSFRLLYPMLMLIYKLQVSHLVTVRSQVSVTHDKYSLKTELVSYLFSLLPAMVL